MAPVKIYYFPVKGRAYLPCVLLQAAGLEYEVIKTDYPTVQAMKAEGKLPFGQVPYMEHDGISIAQSGAISRYIAKIGNLNGSNDADFAKSEMLIGEFDDLLTGMTKCMYTEGKDKNTCFDEYFAGAWKVQMAYLEKLIPDGEKYFIPGAKRCAGGYAIACACEIALSLQSDCLDAFPKLKAFAEEMIASPAMAGLKDWNNYITRN